MDKFFSNNKLIIPVKSWTYSFFTIMKFLNYSGKIIKPNAHILKLFTKLRVDKIIFPISPHIKYNKKKYGEWIWNTNNVINYKTHNLYIFYIHGGAFCCGNTFNVRKFLSRIVEKTNGVVFSSTYRKSPEYKFPIPFNDCVENYEYFLSKIKNIDENPTIIIMGDSAGGNLSINLIAYLIKSNQPKPTGCILISPWVNLADDGSYSSWVDNQQYDFVNYDLAKFFANEYINPDTTNLIDVSPFFLPDDILSKFPPTLIEYGDYETLRDQITQFAVKLKKLNNNTIFNSKYEMTHNYPIFYFTGIPQAEDFFISIKDFIKKLKNINKK